VAGRSRCFSHRAARAAAAGHAPFISASPGCALGAAAVAAAARYMAGAPAPPAPGWPAPNTRPHRGMTISALLLAAPNMGKGGGCRCPPAAANHSRASLVTSARM
jgi:hypothetical protein